MKIKSPFNEFFDFIGKQGVIGLAIGFILGGEVSKVVASLVQDIINPILGVILGAAGSLSEATFSMGAVTISWGNFVNTLINFLIVAFVVFYLAKWLRLADVLKKD